MSSIFSEIQLNYYEEQIGKGALGFILLPNCYELISR